MKEKYFISFFIIIQGYPDNTNPSNAVINENPLDWQNKIENSNKILMWWKEID